MALTLGHGLVGARRRPVVDEILCSRVSIAEFDCLLASAAQGLELSGFGACACGQQQIEGSRLDQK